MVLKERIELFVNPPFERSKGMPLKPFINNKPNNLSMKRLTVLFGFLVIMGVQSLLAQSRQITGTVTSADDGLGIPGVSVVVKGTTIGTTTDIDGKYLLSSMPQNAEIIVFSFIGLKTVEMPVNQSVINVIMESDSQELDEVVVVAYGVQKKSSVTGAISQISSEAISSSTKESLDKALEGKVAGVRVSSSNGNPGSQGEVLIRGVGSITASTQPLYVVDGVPVETGNFGYESMSSNVLGAINPEDIESISVLKDAAASSLYGSRAANGVIVITTKRGTEGETVFNLKSNYGWNTMAVDAFNMMSGPEWVAYLKEAKKSEYLYRTANALFPSQANYANRVSYEAAATAYADAEIAGIVKDINGNTNWKDELFRVAKTQDHQISASGGNKKTKFYTSFGLTKNDGIVLNSSFDRMSGLLNLDHQAKDWLKIGISERLSSTYQKGFSDNSDQKGSSAGRVGFASPIGQLLALEPTAPIYNADGTYNEDVSWGRAAHPSETFGNKMVKFNSRGLRNLTNAYVQINPIKGLIIKSTLGLDNLNQKTFRFWHPESIDGASYNGLGEYYVAYNNSITSSNIATYEMSLLDKHSISILAGFEANRNAFHEILAASNNYSSGNLSELENASEKRTATSSKGDNAMFSYLGRIEYNYDSKYYFSASLRNDASSRLGVDERSAVFYSLSGSWRINKEAFFEENDWLSDLRLRASFGTNGTLPPYDFKHLGLFAMSGNYNNENAIYVDQPENRNLTWEKSRNTNIGIDLGLYSRFSFSLEYWKKYTKDLLLDVNTSYVTAFESTLQNFGEVSNKGFDFEVHTVNFAGKEFKWRTDFNLSYLKTTIEKLPGGNDINQGFGSVNLFLYREGEDMYSMYLPKYYGVNPENGLAQFYIDPEKPATADNLTYYYDNAEKGLVAKALPDVTGGISNAFSYKGLELSFLVTFQFGGNMYDHFGYFSNHDGRRTNTMAFQNNIVGNYWTKPGDKVDFPRPYWGSNGTYSDLWSSRQIHSTDHIRLKEVSLSYALPKQLFSKYGIQDVKVFAKSTNPAMLWIKDKSVDFDPEIALNGVRTTDVPALRTVVLGISLNF
ncbi:MAG: TonB-dependent receptor [Tenuifilaceae bacterium]|jgi:TonB-linked SusC/RagA family outer membrane protein|nr:TonB-dependent receptor [Tenuifilaceae bacterium]